VSETPEDSRPTDRRQVLKAGAGTLAALASLGVVSVARARESSPEADDMGGLRGQYGITRTYTLTPEADMDELITKVEGFVEIISTTPGFTAYLIILDREDRIWNAVSIFDTAEHANASTEEAAEYVAANELASYFIDPTPTITEGEIVIAASA
jgi:hypothetical protein